MFLLDFNINPLANFSNELFTYPCNLVGKRRRCVTLWKYRMLRNFAKTFDKSNASPHVRESMTVLDSGFHPVDSGFRVLDSGFQLSGFRIPKRAGFQIFFCFNAFLRISFSCSNLAILKDVV